jgi:hypothetical protein
MIGSWRNPEVAERCKAHRARIAQLPPEEQERRYEAERQFACEFWTEFVRIGGRFVPRDPEDPESPITAIYDPRRP